MKQRLVILLLVVISAGLFFLYEILWAPNTFDGDRFIIVSKGETFQQVVDSLEHAGILRSRFLIDLAGRILGSTTKMQIGKYRFKSGMSNKEILEDLQYGKTIEAVTITIVEGLRASKQASLLARELGIDSARFMTFVHDSVFAESLVIDAHSLEGYLMPNTYNFYWQADEADIIKQMVGEFWTVFDDSFRAQAESLGKSINEILTLASIIELETAIDSERAIIAGVYYNRLRKGMRLQADPTIQYLLEDGPRPLRYSDLYLESAYNTYRHEGLPPGPINNPGKTSILAALYPASHKYLFFVANGLGGHRFSRTYNEHVRAVRQYRKFRAVQQAMKETG
ncbi:MAG: endolytic transglycosylase MltG [Ignavibacteriae bacterium]|nr:endolytic transglycosylase MltG [Ignavibacteriota bacterium]